MFVCLPHDDIHWKLNEVDHLFRSFVPRPPRPAPAGPGPRHLLSQENSQKANKLQNEQDSTTRLDVNTWKPTVEETQTMESELLKYEKQTRYTTHDTLNVHYRHHHH